MLDAMLAFVQGYDPASKDLILPEAGKTKLDRLIIGSLFVMVDLRS